MGCNTAVVVHVLRLIVVTQLLLCICAVAAFHMQLERHVTVMSTCTSVDPATAAGLVTLVLALVFSCRGIKQRLPVEARNCGQEERCIGRLSGRLDRLAARLHAIAVAVATRHALLPQCQDPSPDICPCFAEQMAFFCGKNGWHSCVAYPVQHEVAALRGSY